MQTSSSTATLRPPASELAQTAVAGVVAAACTVGAVAPLDTLKTRFQVADGLKGEPGRAEPIWTLASRLVRQDGVLSLYAGTIPRFVHLSIWGFALIAIYEQLKRTCRRVTSVDVER